MKWWSCGMILTGEVEEINRSIGTNVSCVLYHLIHFTFFSFRSVDTMLNRRWKFMWAQSSYAWDCIWVKALKKLKWKLYLLTSGQLKLQDVNIERNIYKLSHVRWQFWKSFLLFNWSFYLSFRWNIHDQSFLSDGIFDSSPKYSYKNHNFNGWLLK